MMNIKRDTELLFEISAFRHLDRAWKHFFGQDVANNSEHTFRVAWIALTISGYHKEVDTGRVLKMALVHDLVESRCGDTNYLSRQYVEQKEAMAADDIFDRTVHASEMRELIDEYKKRETIESRIVKDADNLDADIELKELESRGDALGRDWHKERKEMVYPKLYTEVARRFWDEIAGSDPHGWHRNSPRNRFRGGDWKK